jgi:hypothetical protein
VAQRYGAVRVFEGGSVEKHGVDAVAGAVVEVWYQAVVSVFEDGERQGEWAGLVVVCGALLSLARVSVSLSHCRSLSGMGRRGAVRPPVKGKPISRGHCGPERFWRA